jgi:hypothetical protein
VERRHRRGEVLGGAPPDVLSLTVRTTRTWRMDLKFTVLTQNLGQP